MYLLRLMSELEHGTLTTAISHNPHLFKKKQNQQSIEIGSVCYHVQMKKTDEHLLHIDLSIL